MPLRRIADSAVTVFAAVASSVAQSLVLMVERTTNDGASSLPDDDHDADDDGLTRAAAKNASTCVLVNALALVGDEAVPWLPLVVGTMRPPSCGECRLKRIRPGERAHSGGAVRG